MARSNRTHIGGGGRINPRESFKPLAAQRQEFGRRVFRLMMDKGWNQSDLARESDQARNNISTYIRGVSFPSPLNLARLAKALDVSPDDLLPLPTETAILEDAASFEMRVSPGDPTKAWIQVGQVVNTETALKIGELLRGDDAARRID